MFAKVLGAGQALKTGEHCSCGVVLLSFIVSVSE